MNVDNELLKEDVLGYLEQHEQKDLLRFLTLSLIHI